MAVVQEFAPFYLDESVRANFKCVIVILPKHLLVAVDIRLIKDDENMLLQVLVVLGKYV